MGNRVEDLDMEGKKVYQEKMDAWHDQLKARLEKLKAETHKRNADAEIESNRESEPAMLKLEERAHRFKCHTDTPAGSRNDAWLEIEDRTQRAREACNHGLKRSETSGASSRIG